MTDLLALSKNLRELRLAATPGPWSVDSNGITVGAPSGNVLMVNLARNSKADPALIVAAINALPEILEAIDEQTDLLERVSILEKERDDWRNRAQAKPSGGDTDSADLLTMLAERTLEVDKLQGSLHCADEMAKNYSRQLDDCHAMLDLFQVDKRAANGCRFSVLHRISVLNDEGQREIYDLKAKLARAEARANTLDLQMTEEIARVTAAEAELAKVTAEREDVNKWKAFYDLQAQRAIIRADGAERDRAKVEADNAKLREALECYTRHSDDGRHARETLAQPAPATEV